MRLTRFLYALTLCGPAVAQSEAGDVAPVNCWYTEGGCAARTGHCLTRPLKRAPTQAWEVVLPQGGVFEGEPRVWRDIVLLCESRSGRRVLHSYNLGDGEVYCRPTAWSSDLPLGPSIWGDRVAVRTGEKTIEVHRLSRPVAELVQRFEFKAPVSRPLLIGDELYVSAGALYRMQIGKKEPVWRESRGVLSEVSVRGQDVFAVVYRNGAAGLLVVDRKSGRERGLYDLVPEKDPAPGRFPTVSVGTHGVVVRTAPRPGLNEPGVGIDLDWPQGRGAGKARTHDLATLPCVVGRSWIGRAKDRGEMWFERRRGMAKDDSGYLVLADGDRHKELLAVHAAPSSASGVVFLGNIAFDLGRGRILWRHELGTVRRSVPARDSLIVTAEPNRVVVLRGQAPASGWRGMLDHTTARAPRAPTVGKHASATLVTDAGVHRRGTVVVDAARKYSVGRGATLRTFVEDDVSVLLDKKRTVAFWGGKPNDVARGLSALIQKQVDKDFVAIAKKSVSTNDVPVIRRYLEEARARGATKTDIATMERNLRRIKALNHRVRPSQIEKLKKAEKELYPKSLKRNWDVYAQMVDEQPFAHALATSVVMLERDAALYDKICERLQRFAGKVTPKQGLAWLGALLDGAPSRAADIWKRAEAMLTAFDKGQRVRIARWFLDIDPRHAGASKLVHSMHPIDVPGVDKISALEWLDLLESAQDVKFEVVKLPKPNEKFTPSPEIRELHKQLTRWRKDLVAIQSESVVIFTPLANPGRIARCLSMGELVCDTLEEMFAYSGKKRNDPLRLKILLCSSSEEYIKLSAQNGAGHVSWTAGHYDPMARIARMYLPEGEGAFDSVMDVFAHELTHYWVDVRCPLFDNYNKMMVIRGPGYWVVEGFASLLEEFSYDLERRKVSWVKPNCKSLDVIANATDKQLIPWKLLFKISKLQMHTALGSKPFGTVTTRWNVGTVPVMTPIGVFYDQATAAAHYLYNAEGAKYRQPMLEYLGRYYRGDFKNLDIEKATGVAAEVLGKRIEAYAKKISSGN